MDDDGMSEDGRWQVRPDASKIIDIDDLKSIDIDLVCGRVDVIGHDGPDARLEINNVRGENLDVRLVHGALKVSHPNAEGTGIHNVFRIRRWKDLRCVVSADVSLLVPRAVRVCIATVQGDTLIGGVTDGAKLETVSGTVLADSVCGELKLDSVSGKVEARNHYGTVNANTVGGDVIVSGNCHTIKLDSVSGALYCDVFGVADSLRFSTVSGNAAIRVDSGVRVRCVANSGHGHAEIDGQKYHMSFTKTVDIEDGPENAPCTDLHFSAVSGSLKLVRREDVQGESMQTGPGQEEQAGQAGQTADQAADRAEQTVRAEQAGQADQVHQVDRL